MINFLMFYASLFKLNTYCNANNIIYKCDFTKDYFIKPKIDIECIKIHTVKELNKYEIDSKMKLAYFLEKKCCIYLAVFNGMVVGRYVVCNLNYFKPYLYNESPIFKGPSTYYIFFCQTRDAFRGMNIFPYMLSKIAKDYMDVKCQLYLSANLNNLTSQKAIEKTMFKNVGFMKYKKILFWGFCKVESSTNTVNGGE